MLAKNYRLRKDQDIKQVLKKGKAFYARDLGIKFLVNQEENSRFCFVVSNKVHKKAVYRNRLRRRIREVVRLNRESLKGHYDVVVLAKPNKEILARTYQELREEILYVFRKTGMLK